MADAPKTRRLTLGKHSEDVTDAEFDGIKKALGTRISEYTVEPIQPPKPADPLPVATPAKPAPVAAQRPTTPA